MGGSFGENILLQRSAKPVEDTERHDETSLFNKQFTTYPPKYDKHQQKISRSFQHMPLTQGEADYFITERVSEELKKMKAPKAEGPDGLSRILLKQLSRLDVSNLTTLLNLSYNTLHIPSNWKVVQILPIQKPDKPTDDGSSYRYIIPPLARRKTDGATGDFQRNLTYRCPHLTYRFETKIQKQRIEFGGLH